MVTTGIKSFDRSIIKTKDWLNDVNKHLEWENMDKVYIATRAVLQALRDRLPVEEAVQLASEFPMILKGVFYEQYKPHGKPLKIITKNEFLDRVQKNTNDNSMNPEIIAIAVISMLKQRIAKGEMTDVLLNMPEELNDFINSISKGHEEGVI